MTERSVKVYIDAVTRGFNDAMGRESAATHRWATELEATGNGLDRNAESTERLRRSTRGLGDDVDRNSRGFRAFARDLQNADGRLSNIVQTSLALAPALVPLGAAGVTGLAGLTAQLGLTAAAAGTMVLGFHGVGKALSALNDYQLEPSQANLDKLHESMRGLGPEARQFVGYLQSIRPELSQLRKEAQAGLLPGAEEGLQHLMHLLPQVKDLLGTIAGTTGDLFAEAGDNLDDPRWRQFFTYLQGTARPLLLDLGRTVGNFGETFANLVVAFDPLTQQWSTGLLEFSRNLRDSTDNLGDNERFRNFLDYVEKNGPRAVDALGALGGALVQVIEAAAPIGPVALTGLRLFATTIGAIADSPIGPVLIGAAAGIGTLGRSLALLRAVGLTGGKGSIVEQVIGNKLSLTPIRGAVGATRELTAAQRELHAAQNAPIRAQGLGATISPGAGYVTAQDRIASASERVSAAERTKAAAFRESAGALGRASGVAAGLAVATTGLGDKTGYANTETLALIGSIAGLPGVIGGAAIGSVIDFAHANDDLETSIRRADDAISSSDYGEQRRALAGLEQSYSDTVSLQGLLSGKFAGSLLSGSLGDAADEISQLGNALDDTRNSTGGVSTLLGSGLAPALGQAASSFERASQSADDFNQSLTRSEGLLDKREALRSYRQALRDFNQTAKDTPNDLHKGTAAYDEVQDKLDNVARTALDAAQHLRGMDRVDFLANARKHFVSDAQALGLTRRQARALADQLGLLSKTDPKINFKFNGLDEGSARVRRLMALYGLVPKDVKTIVSEAGSNPTRKKIQELAFLYRLTPREVRTLLQAVDQASDKARRSKAAAQSFAKAYKAYLNADDNASGKANAAKARAADMARRWLATLDADNQVGPAVNAAKALLASVKDKTVTITAVNRHGYPGAKADGGLLDYTGHQSFSDGGWPRIGDQRPQIQGNRGPAGITWAETGAGPWEAFISGHPGKRERSRDIADQVVDKLGGQITWNADGAVMQPIPVPQLSGGAIRSTHSRSTVVVERLPRGPVELRLDNGAKLSAHFAGIVDERIEAADDHDRRTGSRGGRR